jgi:DNA replication and repair protein RecF
MWLKSLQAQNLRSFVNFNLTFSPDINFFIGNNGAGKTSILEAVDVLSRGKSFRSNSLRNIANYNDPRLTIFSRFGSSAICDMVTDRVQNRKRCRIFRTSMPSVVVAATTT